MPEVERSTAFKRDYRRIKAMTHYRELDEWLVAVLKLLPIITRCRPTAATMRYPGIGRIPVTVISAPISC
jgi:hypothetical protein